MRPAVVCVLIAGSVLCAHDRQRNLSKYDEIGPFQISVGTPAHESERLEGQVREFLWTHWLGHKRGTVVITHQFVEGIIKASYFVEPDRNGRWEIVEYLDQPYTQFRTKKFSCSRFERVEPDRFHLPLVVVPDFEPRRPEAYLLHPVCSKGKNPELW